jgi:hypothetical protein
MLHKLQVGYYHRLTLTRNVDVKMNLLHGGVKAKA